MNSDAFDHLLDQCLGIRPGEQVVLLTDEGTDPGVVTRLQDSVAAQDGIPLVARMPAPHFHAQKALAGSVTLSGQGLRISPPLR